MYLEAYISYYKCNKNFQQNISKVNPKRYKLILYHSQEWFIPCMQTQHLKINTIYDINKLKKKNPMIILTDAKNIYLIKSNTDSN